MRKIFVASVLIVLLFFASTFMSARVYAACPQPLTIDKSIFDHDFNGQIKISTIEPCFQKAVIYIILAYPESIEPSPHLYSNWVLDKKNPEDDKKTIIAAINLSAGAKESSQPGKWIIKVCNANALIECGDVTKVLGSIPITVNAPPTPTPAPIPGNLPRVTVPSGQCVYQTGQPVEILVDNLQRNTEYRRWWHGDWGTHPKSYRSDNNATPLQIGIGENENTQPATRTLCVDIAGIMSRCFAQNSVGLTFTAGPPTGDRSCIPVTPTPTPKGAPPPPPCPTDKQVDGKCTEITTAIGPIQTDPEKLVTSLLKIILFLSGGITLLLIISGGYRMMISQGNPEKLQEAKETITSAIVGLLFIIFSLVLLEVIGVDILRIPGFGK